MVAIMYTGRRKCGYERLIFSENKMRLPWELPWNVGSFLLFGVGVGLMAYYALRAAISPTWLNWVGIVGGMSGIVWLMAYLSFLGPAAVFLIMVNILTIIVWSIGLSVSLVGHAPNSVSEAELADRPLPL